MSIRSELLQMPRPARRCRFLRRRRRKAECDHRGLVGGPVLGVDVPVGADVQVARIAFPRREEETDLGADADRGTLVVAKLGAGAAVAGDLLIDIAYQS